VIRTLTSFLTNAAGGGLLAGKFMAALGAAVLIVLRIFASAARASSGSRKAIIHSLNFCHNNFPITLV